MIRTILLAYDGSEAANKACEYALDIAQKYGAKLLAISVARPPEMGEDVETEAIIENSRAYHGKLLTSVIHLAAGRKIEVECEVAVGHVAEQILYYADNHKVDLIVLGHRGKTLFRRLLLGSVSKQVVQHADQPVLVVR